ncbi:hypothetical protein RR48_00560 [Papilio machaon]|uniref:Uncharacterized protein n=1 Tax=Papilio machaon TaxID=76193 RepID=A0A0N0PG67_PAPMA|nr:hypothetical protein RR48_00560 [Papilio machaon]
MMWSLLSERMKGMTFLQLLAWDLRAIADLDNLRQQLTKLKQEHEVVQIEVDRFRNDIRKLKSELQYSEKRRMHAEEQEELSSRERAQLRDELTALRTHNNDLMTVCILFLSLSQ